MAKTDYEILRGTVTMGVGKQAKDHGPGDTISLEASDAESLVAAGVLIAASEKPKGRPKTEAARIRELEAELAAAKEGKGGADPQALADAIVRAEKAEEALKATVPMAQLKAALDAKAAADAELAQANDGLSQYQSQIAALTLRVTEAEQMATDAASEAESLERVIAVIEEAQPELVAQAKEAVAAEYQAAADAAAQQG